MTKLPTRMIQWSATLRVTGGRPAVVMILGTYALIVYLLSYQAYDRASQVGGITFSWPAGMIAVVDATNLAAVVCSSVLIVLLITAEFEWGTFRQRLIDGASRNSLASDGLAQVVLITSGIFLITLLLPLPFLLSDNPSTAVTSDVWGVIAGLWLTLLVQGLAAAVVAAAVRKSGPAVAGWAAYFLILEHLLYDAGGLVGLDLDFLVGPTLRQLTTSQAWSDLGALLSGPPADAAPGTALPFFFALAWTAIFVASFRVLITRFDL